MDHIVQGTSDAHYKIQLLHHMSKMYFSLWKPPGVSGRMWSVNWKASNSGEYKTLGGHSGRPSEYLGSRTTDTGVTGICDDWYRSTMGVIGMSLGACRTAGKNFGCTSECRRTNVGLTNTLWEMPGFLWIFIRRTPGVIWCSSNVHEQSTSINSEYDEWIIVHYHFWMILAFIFFNIVFCALRH